MAGACNRLLGIARVRGKDNLITSTQYIGSWTLRQIADRWPEYWARSTKMRANMRKWIGSEEERIYLLLAEQKDA